MHVPKDVLIIGGGIGGLSSAIALGQHGHRVTVIERDPEWSVYGVGITQQANVVRAVADLGIRDDYLAAGFGFDAVEIYAPNGTRVARVPSPRLAEGYPPNLGMGRPALHDLLARRTQAVGAEVRLGVTADRITDTGAAVDVDFSNGTSGTYDFVVGADGVYSQTRAAILPDSETPEFTGQGVWRYNFPRDPEVDCLRAFNGPTGIGLVPMNPDVMYMFVTTPEPGNPRYPHEELAAAMRAKLAGTAPYITSLAEQITDNDGVVYRPLEGMMVRGPWHKGRVVLLGDAVHATTPHLGQGGGMAIEDSIVLAEEVDAHADIEQAFAAYRQRRFDRCDYIVSTSLAICFGQIGRGPPVDMTKVTREMFEVTAQPI
ncbi:FAD-dependent oxidoreductase [Novosphingobium aquae]|uniref:FAD-dependent oxidoreductase n=1 Tax=Novosphingobium aquae TaxID=3133435 RepID=A0ABU8S8P1_9SPHN